MRSLTANRRSPKDSLYGTGGMGAAVGNMCPGDPGGRRHRRTPPIADRTPVAPVVCRGGVPGHRKLLFSALFLFYRKFISNGVQTQRNFLWIFLGQKTTEGPKKYRRGGPRWATPTRARQEAQARPGGLWPPPRSSGPLPKLLVFILANKKSPKSFVAFGLRLVLIFCKTKIGQKTATGTGH